ncbi:hypothetical protein [Nostoc sp. FACHB-888]|uniref:hypothetical protein n=1 Tax=Nostoc sp. FACHB-888 TaxID=2692842 RepID=UPI0016863C6A|nr:hypothetical protein [Nostoc sp. FACHB-888]MBD2247296.1 hypothetical protein [Nostoc sp. FACHB-888]MCC5652556.1 hypothetical protein [Nostoc sp. XA013]
MKNLQHTNPDPDFEKLFVQINPKIANTFTDEQLEAVIRSFGSHGWARHPLDIKVSVPIPGLRFYLVLLAGSERRSQERLRSSKGLYPFWTVGNALFLIGFIIILLACSYILFPFVLSLITTRYTSSSPTLIPWIGDGFECEHTHRVWHDGKCWYYEHSPNF